MKPKTRLLVSDIDGTLVPSDKILTARTIRAVNDLRDAGIMFALTSSRPPRGMRMYVEPLKLTTPLAGFNGGMIVDPEHRVLEAWTIDDELIAKTIRSLDDHHVSVWVYRGQEWYVRDLDGPHVHREAEVCEFQPLPLTDFDSVSDGVAKIVGVSDDHDAMSRAQRELHDAVGADLSATMSQSYYLDVTCPQANKGSVVDYLAKELGVALDEIATIGDAQNDVAMFGRAGLSIAMGNAEDDVKASAREVTSSNEDEGFARAVEQFIVGQ
jgi:Cof subfamily protein (haloacid dehalogenase superfamily)